MVSGWIHPERQHENASFATDPGHEKSTKGVSFLFASPPSRWYVANDLSRARNHNQPFRINMQKRPAGAPNTFSSFAAPRLELFSIVTNGTKLLYPLHKTRARAEQ